MRDGQEITGADVTVENSTEIRATFDLAGAEVGAYDVVVNNGGPGNPTGTGLSAFTVTHPSPVVTGVTPQNADNDASATLVASVTVPAGTAADVIVPMAQIGSGQMEFQGQQNTLLIIVVR